MHQTPVQMSWQGPSARGTPFIPTSASQTGADILDYLKGRGGKIKELEDAVAEQRHAKEQLTLRLQQAEQQVQTLEMRLQTLSAAQPAHNTQQGETPCPSSSSASSVYVADLERLLKEQLQRVLQLEQQLSVAKEQLTTYKTAAQTTQASMAEVKGDADRQVREAQAATAAVQRELSLLHGECTEQVARMERTARMESQRAAAAVELQQATAIQLREAQERLAARDMAREKLAAAEARVQRLEVENDELAVQVAGLQEKLGRGQFGASSMRVLHLRMNPESDYHKQAAQGQAGELQAKVDALATSLAQAQAALSDMEARALAAESAAAAVHASHGVNGHVAPIVVAGGLTGSGLGTSELMSQLAACESEVAVLKHKLAEGDKASARLRAVFKERASVFREAMYFLFGYRVDMTSEATTASAAGSAPTTFTLRPQHADSADSFLVFRYTPEEGMTLVPTAFTGRLAREVDTFVRRFKCIPAFTANLTMESFQKQTQC